MTQDHDQDPIGECYHCEDPVFPDEDHKSWDGNLPPEHQECRERARHPDPVVSTYPEDANVLRVARPYRHDMLPLRDNIRYLEREPECIEGAIEVADQSELTFFMEGVTAYFGPDPDEIAHSWMETFCNNVSRRARSLTIELRKQRDGDQSGLENWPG